MSISTAFFLFTQAGTLVGLAKMEEKISRREVPRQSCGCRIVRGPNIAEKAMICMGELDVHIGFPQPFAFVYDRANLFDADVFIQATPEKHNRRMQICDFRQ